MSDSLSKIVELVVRVVDEGSATLKKTSKELRDYDKTLKESGKVAKEAGKSSKTAAKGIKEFDKEVKTSSKDLKKASKTQDTYRKKVDKTAKSTKTAGSAMKGYSKYAGGLTAALGLLATSFAALGFPVVEAAKFQRKMSEVKAISGATGDAFKAMTAKARELGATTEFTANQAADGLKYLAMAGFNAEESTKALAGVLQLAQAGSMDLGRAADIATNVLTGFGLQVSDLGRVNDVLTQTFTHTNSSLEELGSAMVYVAPVAAGLGANFEDLAAAMGLLHSAGLKGSLAGTTLRGILSRLVSPTKQAADMMDKLGKRTAKGNLEILNAKGNFVGFTSLIKQLEESGASTAEIMKMLGQRAGPGLSALLSQGSAALERMTDLNKTSAGRAKEIAKVMHDNVVGSFRAVKSAVQDVGISIGNILLPAIDKSLKKFQELVVALDDTIKKYPTLSKVVIDLGAAFTALFAAMVIIGGVISSVSWALGGLVGTLVSVATKLGLVEVSSSAFIATFQSLGTIAGSIIGVFTSITTAAVGLGAVFAGLVLIQPFNEWVSSLQVFGVKIGEIGALIAGYIVNFFEKPWGSVKFTWDKFIAGIEFDLGKLLIYIAKFEKKVISVIGDIPGLGKLLGWDKDSNKEQAALNSLVKTGEHLVKIANDKAAAAQKDYEAELTSGQKVINLVLSEINARHKQVALEEGYQRVQAKSIDISTKIADAAKKIRDAYKAQETALATNVKNSQQHMNKMQDVFTQTSKAGQQQLEALGKSIDIYVSQAWKKATSADIVKPYKDQLHKLQIATDAYGTDAQQAMQNIGFKMGTAQVESIQKAISSIDSLYAKQISNYSAYLKSEENMHGLSEDAKTQYEQEQVQKKIHFQEQIYSKKKEYYAKATAALKTELDKSLSEEEKYAGKIKSLNEKIADAQDSGSDQVRALKRQEMTDDQVMADKRLQYTELLSKANQEMETNAAKAAETAQKAMALAKDFVSTTAGGQKDASEAIDKTTQANDLYIAALKKQKSTAEDSLMTAKRHTDLVTAAMEKLKQKTNEVQQVLNKGLAVKVKLDQKDFDTQLVKVSKSRDLYVNAIIKYDSDNKALKDLQAKIRGEITDSPIIQKIKVDGAATITKIIDSVGGLKEKLKDAIEIKIKADDKLTDAEKRLADIVGLSTTIGSKPVSIGVSITGDKEAQSTLDGIVKSTKGLPSVESPKIVPVVAKVEGQEDLAKVVGSVKELDNQPPPVIKIKGVYQAIALANKLIKVLAKIKSKTVTITTKYVSKGSVPTQKAVGGRLPGYGGGDRNPVLAEDGEWWIRKEAVRKYGDSFMSSINNMTLPKFQVGGAVGGVVNSVTPQTSPLANFGKVVLDTGNMSIPALVSKDIFSDLEAQLSKAKRFAV